MVRQEYKRLLNSKQTVIILILILVSVISFYMSFSEKQMFVEMLQNDFSEDLNRDSLITLVNDYHGITFLFNFWFNSDFSQLTTMILFVWAGVFLAPNIFMQKEQGFGNLIVVRTSYREYIRYNLCAQTLYIFTIISVVTILELIIALIWGGGNIEYAYIGEYKLGIVEIALVVLLQIIVFTIYTSLINGIASMCGIFIKNQYVLQAIPLIVFVVLPMLLASTLGNIFEWFARIIVYFLVNNVSFLISNVFQSNFNIVEVIWNVLPMLTYAVVLFVLNRINISVNERNYV